CLADARPAQCHCRFVDEYFASGIAAGGFMVRRRSGVERSFEPGHDARAKCNRNRIPGPGVDVHYMRTAASAVAQLYRAYRRCPQRTCRTRPTTCAESETSFGSDRAG